jgi:hypothetical protein
MDNRSETIHRQFKQPLLMNASTNDLTLWYAGLLVARVVNPIYSDATWYGTFQSLVAPNDRGLSRKIATYIEFCVDWNERTRSDPSHAPDASEFEQYTDVLSSQKWFIRSADGQSKQVLDAPVFFPGDEVSWRLS